MSYTDQAALQPFVRKLASRSRLTVAEAQAVLDLPVRAVQVRGSRDFVAMGEHVDNACFIVDGMVGRFGQNRDGSRQITALHMPADMVDLHSVVIPQATSALQALTLSMILKVPHASLRDAVRRFPALGEAFWRECVVDAAILSEWVVNVGRRDGLSRLAHLFCEVACRSSDTELRDRFSFAFPANQAHIADMLGLTPVHVNRMMQCLRRSGAIRTWHHEIEVVDWDQLVSLGEFDPRYLHLIGSDDGQPGTSTSERGHACVN